MTLPTVEQLRSVAPITRRAVTDDDLDLNGHMNALHFVAAQIRAMRAALSETGITEEYVAARRMGTFAAEQHLRYLGELRLGDDYSVRVRFLGRTGKAIHATGYLVNESAHRLAHVLEVISVHVDQETRRATEIPGDVAAELDARITLGDELGWPHEPRLTLRRG